MNYNDIHKKLIQLKIMSKYGIFGLTGVAVAHSILLYLGYDIFWVHVVFCVFAFMLGMTLSSVFNLCWVHKTAVIYYCSILVLIAMKRHGILEEWGWDLQLARLISTIIGSILLLLQIWKGMTKTNCLEKC